MQCKFWVGQKVVCIDPGPPQSGNLLATLKAGDVYTIADISPLPKGYRFVAPHENAPACVRLKEVTHTPFPDGVLSGFACTRFRPATDISSLEALLASTPVKQKEPA